MIESITANFVVVCFISDSCHVNASTPTMAMTTRPPHRTTTRRVGRGGPTGRRVRRRVGRIQGLETRLEPRYVYISFFFIFY